MRLHIYAKTDTKMEDFDDLLQQLRDEDTPITVTVENRRSFRLLESILQNKDDIFLIHSIADLGMSEADIANHLRMFVSKSISLAIVDIPSTYEYGVTQPINKAVLDTILQSVIQRGNIVGIKRSSVGRSRAVFPPGWDEMYEEWESHQLTSKEFLEKSGLKKATFYNLITEYRELKRMQEDYVAKFRQA